MTTITFPQKNGIILKLAELDQKFSSNMLLSNFPF